MNEPVEDAAILAIRAALRSATESRLGADRLARAVLLFHRGGIWSAANRATWRELTGENEATTKVLCDLARRMIEDAERIKRGGT